jgi:hypothetical protein
MVALKGCCNSGELGRCLLLPKLLPNGSCTCCCGCGAEGLCCLSAASCPAVRLLVCSTRRLLLLLLLAAALQLARLLLLVLSGTPCIISRWLMTSIGTTTACVDALAAAPPTNEAAPARAGAEMSKRSPSLLTVALVTSKVVRYTLRAGMVPNTTVPKPL